MKQTIQIELLATLKRYLPDDPDRFPVESGSRIRDVIRRLNIPEYEVFLVFINGKKGNIDSAIAGGDRIGFFPPLGD